MALWQKLFLTSLAWLAISPSGHIRFAGAKQQIFPFQYVAEAKLRRMCPEPQTKGVSPQGDVKKLFNSVYFVVTIPFFLSPLCSLCLPWLNPLPSHFILLTSLPFCALCGSVAKTSSSNSNIPRNSSRVSGPPDPQETTEPHASLPQIQALQPHLAMGYARSGLAGLLGETDVLQQAHGPPAQTSTSRIHPHRLEPISLAPSHQPHGNPPHAHPQSASSEPHNPVAATQPTPQSQGIAPHYPCPSARIRGSVPGRSDRPFAD